MRVRGGVGGVMYRLKDRIYMSVIRILRELEASYQYGILLQSSYTRLIYGFSSRYSFVSNPSPPPIVCFIVYDRFLPRLS